MLLWAGEQFCYTRCKSLCKDEIFTPELVETNEEHEDLNQMMKKRNFLVSEIFYYVLKSAFRN